MLKSLRTRQCYIMTPPLLPKHELQDDVIPLNYDIILTMKAHREGIAQTN